MTREFYALQRDLDMVIDDVQNLKRSYKLLDYIAKVVRDCQVEQLAQASQMRRIETRMDSLEKRMDSLEKRMDSLEKRMDSIEKRVSSIEKHIEKIEALLVHVVNYMGLMAEKMGIPPPENFK